MVMHSHTEQPTKEQLDTIQMFESILERVQCHLKKPEIKEALNKYKMDPDVDRMKIFYRKEDKGVPIPGVPPTLYAKLLTSFEKTRNPSVKPTISTGFYNERDEPIDDPMQFVGSRCKVIGDVVLDNIYIGDKPTIQIRLNDVIVTEQFNRQRRLHAPTTMLASRRSNAIDQNPASSMFGNEDEGYGDGTSFNSTAVSIRSESSVGVGDEYTDNGQTRHSEPPKMKIIRRKGA